MIRSPLPILLTASLGAVMVQGCATAPTQPTQPTPLDHPALRRYVTGWQERDGAKVASAFGPGGRYRDPSLAAAADAAGIARHVEAHRAARFELQSARQVGADEVDLRWTARWPAPHAASDHVDAVRLKGDAIEAVESTGAASPEAVQLVAAYELAHGDPTPENMQAVFATTVHVFGTTLPAEGLRYDGYVAFLQKLRGTSFRQQPGTRLGLTKDGRIVLHWTLTAGGNRLAAGTDYLTVDNGRLTKVVGVY